MRVQVRSPEERELRRRLAALGSNRSSKIAAGAINDAAKTAQKAIAREITKTYKLASKEVKEALDITKANASRPTAVIKTNRKGISLRPMIMAYRPKNPGTKPWLSDQGAKNTR